MSAIDIFRVRVSTNCQAFSISIDVIHIRQHNNRIAREKSEGFEMSERLMFLMWYRIRLSQKPPKSFFFKKSCSSKRSLTPKHDWVVARMKDIVLK